MALYTFLVTDALEIGLEPATEKKVLAAQFLMLPVAVAMQEDLIATYYMIANVKYDPKIRMKHKNATKLKFNISIMMRGLDGVYSLLVNFIILIKATEVLSLFLNFAALQFLQHIDDIALKLAADGYLTDRLEEVAITVMETKLPRKHSKVREEKGGRHPASQTSPVPFFYYYVCCLSDNCLFVLLVLQGTRFGIISSYSLVSDYCVGSRAFSFCTSSLSLKIMLAT